jgi:hypothetical protein
MGFKPLRLLICSLRRYIMPKLSLSRRQRTMRICSPAVVAVSVVALANTVAAQTRPSDRLPAQFLGCYSSDLEQTMGTCRQPTVEQKASSCPDSGIVVDAKTWTTGEDFTCDKFSVTRSGDGIIVGQTCGGEGKYVRLREYWQLHKFGNMTLLIMTHAKSLKSTIFIRCQSN